MLRFRDLGASFSRFGCFVLLSSFSRASFSKLPLLPAHARPISDMKSQPGLFVSSIPGPAALSQTPFKNRLNHQTIHTTRVSIPEVKCSPKVPKVRAHFGQPNFLFFQQKRKKEILLILIIFTYFKVQKKIEKKKMVRKIDLFFIFLILKSA